MPLLLALVALVVVLTAGALEVGARRQSLRAPQGTANRVPDVYELRLTWPHAGPERPHAVTVIEALARGRIISVDGKGRVALREGGGRAAADAGAGGLVPVHPSLAAAVDVLANRGGVAPLDRLAERLRHTPTMAELAARLRRWHLLLPAGYRPPIWPRIAMLAGAGCGMAALAWSVTAGTPSGSVAGAVVGGVAAAAGAGGWWLSGRHPRVPLTDAGRDVVTGIYTHYRRGGIPDMASTTVSRCAAPTRSAIRSCGNSSARWRPPGRVAGPGGPPNGPTRR